MNIVNLKTTQTNEICDIFIYLLILHMLYNEKFKVNSLIAIVYLVHYLK